MLRKPILLTVALLLYSSFSFAQQPSLKVEGKWKLNFAKSAGKIGLDLAPSFHEIEIKDRQLRMGGRQLSYRLDEKADPNQIIVTDEKNGQSVRVYSAIYRFFKGDLVICVSTGEHPPKAFSAGEFESNYLLRFSRVD